jgi:small subunit ribosomal protein S17
VKVYTGKVIKVKPKTASVEVQRFIAHKVYKRRYKIARLFQVHDEVGVKVGDRVKFTDSKPYSKTKRWSIVKVVNTKKVKKVTKKGSK